MFIGMLMSACVIPVTPHSNVSPILSISMLGRFSFSLSRAAWQSHGEHWVGGVLDEQPILRNGFPLFLPGYGSILGIGRTILKLNNRHVYKL